MLVCWFRQKYSTWHCNFSVFAELHPKPYGDLPSERGPGGPCPSEVMIQTGRQSGTHWEKTSAPRGLHFVNFCIQEAANVSWCLYRLPGLLLTLVGSCSVLSLCRGSWAWHPSHTGNRPLALSFTLNTQEIHTGNRVSTPGARFTPSSILLSSPTDLRGGLVGKSQLHVQLTVPPPPHSPHRPYRVSCRSSIYSSEDSTLPSYKML